MLAEGIQGFAFKLLGLLTLVPARRRRSREDGLRITDAYAFRGFGKFVSEGT